MPCYTSMPTMSHKTSALKSRRYTRTKERNTRTSTDVHSIEWKAYKPPHKHPTTPIPNTTSSVYTEQRQPFLPKLPTLPKTSKNETPHPRPPRRPLPHRLRHPHRRPRLHHPRSPRRLRQRFSGLHPPHRHQMHQVGRRPRILQLRQGEDRKFHLPTRFRWPGDC